MKYQIQGEPMPVVTGPGRILLQTMPMSNFAGAISGLFSKN